MKQIKVMTILGTRPEIIRLSRVMDKLDENTDHTVVHTGQNYDQGLRDIFYDKNLLDHASKHEFFGRLANAANWYIKNFKRIEDQKVHELLSLVLSESKEILLEMENGDFMYLPITFDNIIFDDITNKVRKTIKK